GIRLNQQRYAHFYSQPALPCALAFDGPAYKALEASSLDAAGLHWAQDNLRILSGLYGLLRPLDAIRPYRLDMGTKLDTPRGPLPVVATINQELQQQQQHQGRPSFVVNVASQEYWKAVSSADTALAAPVYTCSFPGPAVYAKQARGAMARFLITTQADSPQQLRQFTGKCGEGGQTIPSRPAAGPPSPLLLASRQADHNLYHLPGNHGEWQWDDSTSSEFVLVFVRNVKAAKASKAGQKAAKACTGADTKPDSVGPVAPTYAGLSGQAMAMMVSTEQFGADLALHRKHVAIESIASLLAQDWVPLGMGAWGAKPQVPCDTRWASYISSTVTMLRVWAHARDAVSQLLERQKGATHNSVAKRASAARLAWGETA
ncbi:hypothetical protein QJQ45_013107, partial [Haematococcus lacustris]